jgi:hypothetical protein
MKNRPCWRAIWPAALAREKRNVLIGMDFEYDFNADMFVHLQLRKALSLDAVSDMQLDELKVVVNGKANPRDVEFRFRGEPQEGLRELLIERYGWGLRSSSERPHRSPPHRLKEAEAPRRRTARMRLRRALRTPLRPPAFGRAPLGRVVSWVRTTDGRLCENPLPPHHRPSPVRCPVVRCMGHDVAPS